MSNYLIHHGVKGQTWGQRNYQNKDGSLTPLGVNHYYRNGASASYATNLPKPKSLEDNRPDSYKSKVSINSGYDAKKFAESHKTTSAGGSSSSSSSGSSSSSSSNELMKLSDVKKIIEENNAAYKADPEEEEKETKKKSGSKKSSSSKKKKDEESKTEEKKKKEENKEKEKDKEKKKDTVSQESIESLAYKVIKGEYGNGADRKNALGENYDEVQKMVNEILKNKTQNNTSSTKTTTVDQTKKSTIKINSEYDAKKLAEERRVKHSAGYSCELKHHGILGQKWGVRRYQNPDGTRTEEGKKRYSDDAWELKQISKKRRDQMTNSELRKANERMNLESNYANLSKQTGRVNKAMAETVIASALTFAVINLATNKINRGVGFVDRNATKLIKNLK